MQFPNAYKGVKKIYLAELMMLVVAVLGIILAAIAVAGGATGKPVTTMNDTEIGIAAGLALLIGVLVIVGFVMMLIGVINAKKDEDSFRIALYAILLGIAISVVNAVVGNKQPQIQRWLTLGASICSLFSTYYVLCGIGNLAERMGDGKVKMLADKARNVLCFTFAASYLLKLIPDFLGNPLLSNGVNVIGLILEIVSYGFFLVVLSKGKRMLSA